MAGGQWHQAHAVLERMVHLREHELVAQLKATPTVKVSTFAAFMTHVVRCMTLYSIWVMNAAKVDTLAVGVASSCANVRCANRTVKLSGSRKLRQLCWRTSKTRQQAYAHMCNAITNGDHSTVVASGDAPFSRSSGRGNPSFFRSDTAGEPQYPITLTVSLRKKLGLPLPELLLNFASPNTISVLKEACPVLHSLWRTSEQVSDAW